MPYRDFLYLDASLIQSLIAQLDKGLVKEFLTNKRMEGEVSLGLGLLQLIMPSGRTAGAVEWTQSKVLDDYAFEVALEKLTEAGLLPSCEPQKSLADKNNGFLLVQGEVQIYDYHMLRRLLNEPLLASFLGNKPPSEPAPSRMTTQERRRAAREQQKQAAQSWPTVPHLDQHRAADPVEMMKAFLDVFYEDMTLIKLTAGSGTVAGPLRREFLREDIITLTYKYGSHLQGAWNLLGLISRIPHKGEGLEQGLQGLKQYAERVSVGVQGSIGAVSDVMNVLLGMMTAVQMLFGTVTHPDVGVTPIALYREIDS